MVNNLKKLINFKYLSVTYFFHILYADKCGNCIEQHEVEKNIFELKKTII